MKKQHIIYLFALLIIANNIYAQAPIVVQNGNNKSFFNNVPAAVLAAQNGDTIYIPSGTWNIGATLYIDKELHIIGSGHNPDSALCKFPDYCYVTLRQGASNGSLTGVQLDGFNTDGSNPTIINYSFTRNRIISIALCANFTNSLITENIISGNIYGNYSINNGFFNNFINSFKQFSGGNTFKNNVFLYPWDVNNLNSCLFENNVFYLGGCSPLPILCQNNYCNFNNNLFVGNGTFPNGTNFGTNNIVNQPQSSIFINQSGTTFSYLHDYHLQPTCPGKNAGTDGKDIGIYGGLFPWKDGSLPSNPHVQFRTIGGTTDQNGNLQINVKVKAQDN